MAAACDESRLAAEPPAKTKYLAWDNAYHGDTLGSVSVGGVARFHEMFRPLLFDVVRLPAPDTYRLPPGVTRETACGHYLGQLEAALAGSTAKTLAAVVIEPLVQAAAGMVTHPPGFLRGVRELTRRYDVLLIADEVAVGMGRTGKMFACEQEGVVPDFLCLAKGLDRRLFAAGGDADDRRNLWRVSRPLRRIEDRSFTATPTAAIRSAPRRRWPRSTCLRRNRRWRTCSRKSPGWRSTWLASAEHPHVGDVRQRGLIAGIELVRDRATKEPYPWAEKRGIRVCQHALTEGVWLRPLGNVVVIMPPLAISLDELDRICGAVERGIAVAVA